MTLATILMSLPEASVNRDDIMSVHGRLQAYHARN